MEYNEMLKYIYEERERMQGIFVNLAGKYQATTDKFNFLADELFNGKDAEHFLKIIPKEYHPLNVHKRAKNAQGLTFNRVFEDAIEVYKCAILEPRSEKSN